MRKLSLILVVLLALCGFACAETVETVALTPEDLVGEWNMEYATAEGFMISAEAYGFTVVLTFMEDGNATLTFDETEEAPMQWAICEGKAYISGYNPDGDVELLIDAYGVLEITDPYGSMFFTRIVEETAE